MNKINIKEVKSQKELKLIIEDNSIEFILLEKKENNISKLYQNKKIITGLSNGNILQIESVYEDIKKELMNIESTLEINIKNINVRLQLPQDLGMILDTVAEIDVSNKDIDEDLISELLKVGLYKIENLYGYVNVNHYISNFLIDDMETKTPIGMNGKILKGKMKIQKVQENVINNYKNLMSQLFLNIELITINNIELDESIKYGMVLKVDNELRLFNKNTQKEVHLNNKDIITNSIKNTFELTDKESNLIINNYTLISNSLDGFEDFELEKENGEVIDINFDILKDTLVLVYQGLFDELEEKSNNEKVLFLNHNLPEEIHDLLKYEYSFIKLFSRDDLIKDKKIEINDIDSYDLNSLSFNIEINQNKRYLINHNQKDINGNLSSLMDIKVPKKKGVFKTFAGILKNNW